MLDDISLPSTVEPNPETDAPTASDRPSPWRHRRVSDIPILPRPKPPGGLRSRGFGDFLAHCYPPWSTSWSPGCQREGWQ
jgi:hypothetical protein